MRVTAQAAIDRLGLDINLDIRLADLSVANQQLVAIARGFGP